VPISPLRPGGARGKRRIRLWVVSLAVLVIAGSAAAVVASATSQNSPGSRHAGPRSFARSLGNRAALHGGRLASGLGALERDNRAISRVLAYTPFVRAGLPRRRMIALTFDDGPSPYTPQIVRVLVKMHVPATFFVVGQQLTYFSAGLRDELRDGFVVGDHTENHPPLSVLSASRQLAQIEGAAVGIQRVGAPFPRLFRPPYGMYNARTLAILRRLRMLMVMWSVDPRDWLRPGTRAIVQRVLAGAQPGAIVEMHDGGGDRSQTVAALPRIIDGLRRRHYELVTVPQLLSADPPPRHQQPPHVSE
jgi:peptidoglycan/xylan/chitin deacetylase (PgdA/CDA1 family)